MNTIILASLERGLTMNDVRRMQVGQVVDFVIDFNKRQEESEKREKYEKKHGRTRKATQEDINAFFG